MDDNAIQILDDITAGAASDAIANGRNASGQSGSAQGGAGTNNGDSGGDSADVDTNVLPEVMVEHNHSNTVTSSGGSGAGGESVQRLSE